MRVIENTTHIETQELKPLLMEWAKKARVSTSKLRVRCLKYQSKSPYTKHRCRAVYYPLAREVELRFAESTPLEDIIHIWVHELQHHKYWMMPYSKSRRIKNSERWAEENTVRVLVKHGIPIAWTGYKVRKRFAMNIKQRYGVELPKSCVRGNGGVE